METEKMLAALTGIFGGISRSRLFWDMQQTGACSPGKLAPMLHVSAARITKMLSSLESKQLIVRENDPTDKRRVNVRLTNSGSNAVRTVQAQAMAHAQELFENLGEEDSQEFLRIVNKILSFEEMVDEPVA